MGSDGLVKGSVTIAGHRTSLSLEPAFWAALRSAAVTRQRPLNALIAEIDEARTTNLSSAVRVWLFEQAQRKPGLVGAGVLERARPCGCAEDAVTV